MPSFRTGRCLASGPKENAIIAGIGLGHLFLPGSNKWFRQAGWSEFALTVLHRCRRHDHSASAARNLLPRPNSTAFASYS